MFKNLTTTELVYLCCAIVGGGVFVLRSLMMLIGMGGDGEIHDGDSGGDISDSDGSPVHDFKLVSIHGITAFLLMLGLVGFLMSRDGKSAPWLVAAIAIAIGTATMFVLAKLFQTSRKLQSDGTIYPADAVGAEGSVYLTIRAGEIGKIQVTVRGALKIFDARAKDSGAELKTGTAVKVVAAGDVFIVETADGK